MVLVPRHGTSPLDCHALWHGTALSEGFSAVPGPESGHGGTTRHGTAVTLCLIVSCLIVPCRVVLVPCSASAARLENYTHKLALSIFLYFNERERKANS